MFRSISFVVLTMAIASCGSKKSSDDATTTTDSAEYTAIKTIMAAKCSGGSCHPSNSKTDWYNTESAFKTNLATIQGRVAGTISPTMPPTGYTALTTDEKAKFAAYTGK